MKAKKLKHDKENYCSSQQQNSKQNSNLKRDALTKRRENKTNRDNHIQITEALDINPITYPSKQFVLSRQSIGGGSRSSLKDINFIASQKSKEFKTVNHSKQQELFDRRLSLKCTGNYSQQLDSQKSQRLSMAPLRRDPSFGNQIIPESLIDQRESTTSYYQNSLFSSDSKSKMTMKKETIISNLVNKLDYEEDLRSIIEMKLKNGSNTVSQVLGKDRKNQSYLTDFTDQNSQQSLVSKLKQCQSQIKYFKTVIREMSEKIVELTEERKFHKKKNTLLSDPQESCKPTNSVMGSCQQCGKAKKIGKQIGVQASSSQLSSKEQPSLNQSYDFLDNLQRTLKVLDSKKN